MRALRALVLAVIALVLSGCTLAWPPVPGPAAPASSAVATDPASGLPWIALADLPPEGRRVYAQIAKGGPFSFGKDGSTFLNSEGLLPDHKRGYYREYTVLTPGVATRGARRIVCGGKPVTSTEECYYTDDHYRTFRRIRQ